MSSQIKPIKLRGILGPNPLKVDIVLRELGIPYEGIEVAFQDVKKPEYLALNVNGRAPTIEDPNTGLILWESGAIIEYLIERYDKEHKFSFAPGTHEASLTRQWLYFQMSGQGPYYGQMTWFQKFHHEKLPSAVERYLKEIIRVTGVLEEQLSRQKKQHGGDGPWLVGDKLSYADLAFIPYQNAVSVLLPKSEFDADNFPLVKEWLAKLTSREGVKAALEADTRLRAQHPPPSSR